MPSRYRIFTALGLSALCGAAGLAMEALGVLGGLAVWLYVAGMVGFSLLIGWRAVAVRAERRMWTLLAGGVGLGVVGWGYFFLHSEEAFDQAYPSLADVVWLACCLLTLIAMVLVIRQVEGLRYWMWLDAVTAICALGAVAVSVFAVPLYETADGPRLYASFGYVLLDVVLLGGVASLLTLSPRPRGLQLLALSLAWHGSLDLLMTYLVAAGIDHDGWWWRAVWFAGVCVMAAAAWVDTDPWQLRAPTCWRSLASSWVFGVLGVVVVVLVAGGLVGNRWAAVSATVAVVFCAVRVTAFLTAVWGRERAEQTLLELSDAAEQAIWGIDRDGRVVFANQAAGRLLGYEREEMLGADAHELVHHHRADGSPYPREECLIQQAMDDGVRREVSDEVFWRKDGSPVPVSYSVSPVLADGRPDGALVVFFDRSERERAERAERASKAKSDYLARMSHELRTPLSAIIGYAQLLGMEDDKRPEEREVLSRIVASASHLSEVVSDVLDFSALEAGKLSVSLEAVDAAQACREAIGLMRPLADEREVSIELRVPSQTVWAQADARRLRQVLINLLSNAIKYNHPGGSVQVRCSKRPGKVVVAVADTGRGMSSEQLAKLFVPYERAGAEASGEAGSGLGLVVSKLLVEAMGGQIRASSVLGSGTTLTVQLNRADGSPSPT